MEIVANSKGIGLKRELKTILSDLVEARYRAWTEEGGGRGMVIVDDAMWWEVMERERERERERE